MAEQNIDYRDGEEERKKPYRYECPKHGGGYAALDECPKCAEESYLRDLGEQSQWIGKCKFCKKTPKTNFNEDGPEQHYIAVKNAFGLMNEQTEIEETLAEMCDECWEKADIYLKSQRKS
jgi:glutaredoxin